jgi:hypothetical protein
LSSDIAGPALATLAERDADKRERLVLAA